MSAQTKPILLYNDECGVCRRIGHWVQKSANKNSGDPNIIVRPIGDDPENLKSLNANLDIWDAYDTIHLLMPDGSMKLGGEAVAEVLRNLPNTGWFNWIFDLGVFGRRPGQALLNLAYSALAGIRPLLGCESCGIENNWTKPLVLLLRRSTNHPSKGRHSRRLPHFTPVSHKALNSSKSLHPAGHADRTIGIQK
jgi:predicted DCC family thiol-disulfide oxidoreductase YuxK